MSPGRFFRAAFLVVGMTLTLLGMFSRSSLAAPYAAHVMDARTGETLFAENADTRLHPASLTKMMTLYIAFQEIEAGRLSLDTMITVSRNAAGQPPSRLGLKAGQKIQLRYLIRAAAVKSANDAAQAIGDAIGGDQATFAARMTRTARALGMANTTFKNANGLTSKGHLSTAHDMSIMGRRLFYDFPSYYNIFSRRTTDAGMAEVANTNRRFLDAYKGADGIKTGYTDAAGFNLTASAERGGVRIIATVFGGSSTADRNAKVSKLMDKGFALAPQYADVIHPAPIPLDPQEPALLASVDADLPEVEGGAGKTIRVSMAITSSVRPLRRPVPSGEILLASALSRPEELVLDDASLAAAPTADVGALVDTAGIAAALAEAGAGEPEGPALVIRASTATEAVQLTAAPRPPKRNKPIYDTTEEILPEFADVSTDEEEADARVAALAAVEAPPAALPEPAPVEVVTTVSTSGGRQFGVNIGRYGSAYEAERALLQAQLGESATLTMGLRKVVPVKGGYDAVFMGLTSDEAALACRKLSARQVPCETLGEG